MPFLGKAAINLILWIFSGETTILHSYGRAGRKGAPLPKMFSETLAGCVKAGKTVEREGMGKVEDAGAGSEDGSVTGARFQPCFLPE